MLKLNEESRLVRWGLSLFGIVGVLFVWQLVTATFGLIPTLILPPPTEVAATFLEFRDLITPAFYSTIEVAGVGWIIVIILGVIWGSIFAVSDKVYDTFMPLVVSLNSVPRVTLAPVILFYVSAWFNPRWAKYVIAIWVAFFALFVNIIEGLEESTENEHHLLDSLGATTWQKYKKLLVWNAMPHFLDGLKMATVGALVGAVVGEYVRAQEGIGALVLFALASIDYEVVFASVGLVTVVSVSVVLSIFVIQDRFIYWKETNLFT
jgi:NitT/TauT family transport system permease protein